MDGPPMEPAEGPLDRAADGTPTVPTVTLETRDLDDVRSYLEKLYCPITVSLPPGIRHFAVRSEAISLGSVTLGTAQLRSDIVSVAENDAYHVLVPTAGRMSSRQCGQEVLAEPGVAVLYQPGATSYDRSTGASGQLSVRVQPTALEHELATMLGRSINGPVDLARSMPTSRGPGRRWLELVRLVYEQLGRRDGEAWHPLAIEQLQRTVISQLLLTVPHQHRDELDRPRPPGPPRALRRVVDAIHDDPAHPFTVGDLAAMADVSVRSLQDGFRRHFGMTPMGYVRQVRLALAHDLLYEQDRRVTTVAAVAHRCGFFHLGRFSAMYRAHYGVHPSDTLSLDT